MVNVNRELRFNVCDKNLSRQNQLYVGLPRRGQQVFLKGKIKEDRFPVGECVVLYNFRGEVCFTRNDAEEKRVWHTSAETFPKIIRTTLP